MVKKRVIEDPHRSGTWKDDGNFGALKAALPFQVTNDEAQAGIRDSAESMKCNEYYETIWDGFAASSF